MTLNPFPELLSFSLLAPFFLRIVLGMVFLNLGYLKFRAEKQTWASFFDLTALKPAMFWVSFFALVEILGGLMLIVGFYTQIVALAFAVITLVELYVENREPVLLNRNFVFYLLLFVISLSLLFSGAGAFAVDLPL
jgi:putative oxidoreductase